eukprot:TRINITY_DN16301_c0_g1_i1.p1 TRINITY_DN16301_c0_g1~~TRINITY_DN16301_c0_g1_i1.p1  ORF type:complete len:734 (-),score=74.95 TRINITY_DN16301_c0_g1_i1:24-2069(-)
MAPCFRSAAGFAVLLAGLDVATALVRASHWGVETDTTFLEHGRRETSEAWNHSVRDHTSRVWPERKPGADAVASRARYWTFGHHTSPAVRKRHAAQHGQMIRRSYDTRAVARQKARKTSGAGRRTVPRMLVGRHRNSHFNKRNELAVRSLERRHKYGASVMKSAPEDAPVMSPPGVVHFLFLIDSSLPHVHIWQRFFRLAPADTWRAWVHCAFGCDEKLQKDLPNFHIVETVPSRYCIDLVTPMAQLSRAALRDESILYGTKEKFLFVSSSTLPSKPFGVVYRVLMAHMESDICFLAPDQWERARIEQRDYRIAKHSQWAVLNREHAELFADHWLPELQGHTLFEGPMHPITWNVSLPSPNGMPPTVVSRELFSGVIGQSVCSDEEAMFTTIFGAVEVSESNNRTVKQFSGLNEVAYDALMPMQGRCHTSVIWTSVAGSLPGYILDDPGSRLLVTEAGDSHPFVIASMSNRSLAAVRAHGSLFIRKVSDDADLKYYPDIVFAHSTDHSLPFRQGFRVPVHGQIRAPVLDSDGDGRCLGVDHASVDGRQLHWTKCSIGDQGSRFIFDEGSAGLIRWGAYFFEHRCLEVKFGQPTLGAAVVLGFCGDSGVGSYDRIFAVSRSSAQTKIRWALYPDLCLEVGDVSDSRTEESPALRVASCDTEEREEFRRFLVPDARQDAYDIL